MTSILKLNRNLLIFGIPLLLFASLVILIKSGFVASNQNLGLAVTIDLLLTVPLVYYLLIRKTKIVKTTVVPVMLIGLVIGTFLLPKGEQGFLDIFKIWVLPIIELSVLFYVISKALMVRKEFKKMAKGTPDFFTTIKAVSSAIMPKRVSIFFATEIAVLYHGLLKWRKIELDANEFSYHRNGSGRVVLGALLFVICIETVVFHLLLLNWSHTAAWILTGISIYSGFQLLGIVKSISQRPIVINKDSITLRYGLMSEVIIDYNQIDSIDYSTKFIKEGSETKMLSPMGDFESHNVIFNLSKNIKINDIYGFSRESKSIAFLVDDLTRFREMFLAKQRIREIRN